MPKIKTIENFASYVKIHIIETFPNCIVDVKTIKKDNGYQTGIVICKKGTIFAPIIYLEPYFAKLQAGTPLPDILDKIVNDYRAKLGESVGVNLDDIKDFSLVKDKICFKLINRKFNNKLLATIPNRDYFNDMAVIYCVKFPSIDGTVRTVKVTNALAADIWDVDEAQLYELARRNTPILQKGKITPLTNIGYIASRLHVPKDNNQLHLSCNGFDITMASKKRLQLYVATNAEKVNGAGVILYDGLLETMAEYIGNFFVLPSSIHECILAPGDPEDAKIMIGMVREVNATVVSDEDVLSENCFFYDAKSHTLEMIE